MDAAPHSTEGTASAGPFLFSIPGAAAIDLYPILKNGASLNIIEEHLPGRLSANNHWGNLRPTPLYYRLYRFLNKLVKSGFLTSEKGVQDLGLGDRPCLWFRPTLTGLRGIKSVDLIKRAQNSNSPQMTPLQPGERPVYDGPTWMRIPKRSTPRRVGAALRLMRIRTNGDGHWQFVRRDTGRKNQKGEPIKELQPALVEQLKEPEVLYRKYLQEIDGKKIMLVPRGESRNPDPSRVKLIPYRTRFNDPGRRRRQLDRYDYAWQAAEEDEGYRAGVYLTLTTDPAMHQNLWAANRHCSPAWNRYISYLRKKFGFRPRYIRVTEYQENGLIHLHVVLFGIDPDDKELQNILKYQSADDWARCGQGRVTKAIPIHLDAEGLWQWTGKRPEDARQGESVTDYLKKYLKKSVFNPQDLYLYWAINSRFFSCSRVFSPAAPPKPDTPPLWDYVGITPDGAIPDWLRYLSERRIPDPIEIPRDVLPQTWRRDNPYLSPGLGFVPASALGGPPAPAPTPPPATAPGAKRLNFADFM
ncbi:MAG: hypothetical protein WC343_03015 [Bacilli bacterium]